MTAVILCEEHSCRKGVSFSLGISEGRVRSRGNDGKAYFYFYFEGRTSQQLELSSNEMVPV